MISTSEILEDVRSLTDAIDIVSDAGIGPTYGPYSNSRLDTAQCGYQFKRRYIDKAEGVKNLRFGTDVGSAAHEFADLDVSLRMLKDITKDVEDIVEEVIRRYPECEKDRGYLEQAGHLFRTQFDINSKNFVSSEQRVAVDFDMNPVAYNSDKAWFRGRIDYLEKNAQHMARVVDFKNYPRIHSEAELADHFTGVGKQLMGYLAMIMALDPRIELGYYEVYYFRFGTSREHCQKNDDGFWVRKMITRDQVNHWWRFCQRRMLAVERKQSWEAIPSKRNCQYCDFLHECPKNVQALEYIVTDEESAKEASERLIVLDDARARLRDSVRAYIDEHDGYELSNGDRTGQIERTRYDIDVRGVLEICESAKIDPEPYIKTTKRQFDKLMSNLPEDKQKELETYIERTTYTRRKTH